MERRKLLGNSDFDFLLSYGGYLMVSALSELCGISLTQDNSKEFINECIENLYSNFNSKLTKTKSEYILSIDDVLITKFIKFYQTIGGRKYLYNNGDECTDITGGYVVDKLRDYFQTTYPIKLDDCIQLRTNHYSNAHTMAGIESVNKINFNTLFIEGYKTIKSDIEVINSIDNKNNYSAILLLNQILGSDHKAPNADWYAIDALMSIRYNNYVGRKIVSGELISNLTSQYIGAFASMMVTTTTESFINIYSIYLEKQYEIGDSYLKNLTDFKNKYSIIPCEIKIDINKVKINTNWQNNTNIYIPDNNIENLPDGVYITYRTYIYKDGNEYTNITGGYSTFGSSNKQNSYLYIYYGGANINNPINIEKYSKICYDMETTSNFQDQYPASYSLFNETEDKTVWRYFSPPKLNERRIIKVELSETDKTNGCKYLSQVIRGDDKMLNFKVYEIWFE